MNLTRRFSVAVECADGGSEAAWRGHILVDELKALVTCEKRWTKGMAIGMFMWAGKRGERNLMRGGNERYVYMEGRGEGGKLY